MLKWFDICHLRAQLPSLPTLSHGYAGVVRQGLVSRAGEDNDGKLFSLVLMADTMSLGQKIDLLHIFYSPSHAILDPILASDLMETQLYICLLSPVRFRQYPK